MGARGSVLLLGPGAHAPFLAAPAVIQDLAHTRLHDYRMMLVPKAQCVFKEGRPGIVLVPPEPRHDVTTLLHTTCLWAFVVPMTEHRVTVYAGNNPNRLIITAVDDAHVSMAIRTVWANPGLLQLL